MSALQDVMERKERPAYVRFETRAVENKAASLQAGYYVGDNIDFVLITPPYSKDVMIFKVPFWLKDLDKQVMEERLPRAWAEQYKDAYRKWKAGQEVPLNGYPVKGWGVLSPAQQETILRANILTVEDLARVTDEGIRRIGMGAIELRRKAEHWLAQMKDKGPLTQQMTELQAENDRLKANQATMQKHLAELSSRVAQPVPVALAPVPAPEPLVTISAAELLDPTPELASAETI